MSLAESVVLFQMRDLFGVLSGFKILQALQPKCDLFAMLLLDCGEKFAAITV
jgi:hypothetical protein